MKTLLCCILKLENHYIGEWLNHYKSLGFSHIHIYDNNDANGPYAENIEDVPEVREGLASGFISITKIPGALSAQVPSYNECYKKFSNSYDWIAFFDVDEYLILKDHENITSFLSQDIFNDYQMIHLNWKVFDDNDLIYVENNDYNVQQRFLRPSKNASAHIEIKSIVRTKIDGLAFSKNPHTMDTVPVKCCNALGKPVDEKSQRNVRVVHKSAWINHYICKTVEEYCTNKLLRLGGHTPHAANLRYNMDFFFKYNIKTREKVQAYNDCINKRLKDSPIKTTPQISVKYTAIPQSYRIPYSPNIIPVHSERVKRAERSGDPIGSTGRIRRNLHL